MPPVMRCYYCPSPLGIRSSWFQWRCHYKLRLLQMPWSGAFDWTKPGNSHSVHCKRSNRSSQTSGIHRPPCCKAPLDSQWNIPPCCFASGGRYTSCCNWTTLSSNSRCRFPPFPRTSCHNPPPVVRRPNCNRFPNESRELVDGDHLRRMPCTWTSPASFPNCTQTQQNQPSRLRRMVPDCRARVVQRRQNRAYPPAALAPPPNACVLASLHRR